MNVYKCWYRVIACLLSREIIICQNATGNLSFSWRKETIFIGFTAITFAVYEREQNWSPQTTPYKVLLAILGDYLFSGK